MAEAAIEILADPERQREVGRAGRAEAHEKYSVERIVSRYEAFYEEVLGS
jgi:glycosyltransferase involved in cell wall biosynthesis